MYHTRTPRPLLTALVLTPICFAPVASADVTLPAILGSNMVMQRSTHAALWGWAAPGERIRISQLERGGHPCDVDGGPGRTTRPVPYGHPATNAFWKHRKSKMSQKPAPVLVSQSQA